MSEVLRSVCNLMEDGSRQLRTDLEKGPEHKRTITFRPLSDTHICPIIWIKYQINFKGDELCKKHLRFFGSMHRIVKDEELSTSIRIMEDAGIHKGYTVITIRKVAITKAVAQVASQTDINRFSRHSEGSNTMMIYYDTNLNDNIRM
ncbi:MAG: hypothetical protein EZS28_028332 [Streblomastix strix]|uniref:Tyr recombinase domain-containing protein n=1 Tax=Streblomastix strix TaxID=222440 RepID=A0A5J4V0W0_9EUKA|nr:MAG: hypothetical protein EZS28_028332 [Streblomastix strix]